MAELWEYILGHEWVLVVIGIALFAYLANRVGYSIGYARGKEFSKLEGAYCDVCHNVSGKFYNFRMTVMCEQCFLKITSNKEMKCKFCDKHIEVCSCT